MHGDLRMTTSPDPYATFSPATALQLRTDMGWTQAQAAAAAGYSHPIRWSEIERGVRSLDDARWELVRIKAGVHPEYTRR